MGQSTSYLFLQGAEMDGWSGRRGDRCTGHVVVTYTDRVSDMEHMMTTPSYIFNIHSAIVELHHVLLCECVYPTLSYSQAMLL